MNQTPDYQSVLEHMRARRAQLDAAIVAMEAMLGVASPRADDEETADPPRCGRPPGASSRPPDALTESAIRTALKQGADTVAAIAEQTNIGPASVQKALKAMRVSGRITMTGRTNKTRYFLA